MTTLVILIALAGLILHCARPGGLTLGKVSGRSEIGCPSLLGSVAAAAETITVADSTPLAKAFEQGLLARDTQMAPDGRSVVLYDLNLVEDDGPGACASRDYGPAAPTTIRGGVQVKKVLRLNRAGVLDARVVLCVGPQEGETQPLRVAVNGHGFACEAAQSRAAVYQWQTIRIPDGLLHEGDNEIVLSCSGAKGWWVAVAQRELILRNEPERKGRPNRSFRSTDSGQTWSPGLGNDGGQDGELMIRLHVGQYAARGELVGPVIDIAALAGGSELGPSVLVESVRLDAHRKLARKELPKGTGMGLFIRSGDKPVYDPACWSEWRPCDESGEIRGGLKRFVQWRAVLSTRNPKATPVLRSVYLQAKVQPQQPAWAANIRLLDSHNEEIRYTSIPFEYEKFDEPQLAELRKRYKLDEVVAGARSETEKLIKLRNWVCAQWKYDPPIPYYPAWDAREILRLRKGFCVQYAIVCMQCALSLGLQARFVFGHFPNVVLKGQGVSGHEVTEVWSNDLGKWVMLDAQRDESFVNRRTGELAGMLELHEDQLDTYFPEGVVERGASFDEGRPSETMLWWKGAELATRPEKPVLDIKWGYMQWMPRNNFYAHRFPEPVRQGLTWSWTGYWNWQDARTARQWRFGRHTSRQSDINWTINQVRWAAAPAEQPGLIRLNLGTVTPDFDAFLASVDGGEWRPVPADAFNWPLHAGRNRLEMRVRNRAGVLGRKSWLELEYSPRG